jgi:hypothetical protein
VLQAQQVQRVQLQQSQAQQVLQAQQELKVATTQLLLTLVVGQTLLALLAT